MNSLILNRDFTHPTDGWYQVEAKGNHPNRAAGVVQVIDDEATQAIVNRFNSDATARKLRHGDEMLIDHEHFKDDPDKESRAYGWLTQLQNRDDGIYGRIRWTKTGKEAVDGGDYRFFSTEYDPADVKLVNDGKTRSVRPLRLDGLSLTNMNNNRGQKPITNRAAMMPADGMCPECDVKLMKNAQGGMACPDCGKTYAEPGGSAASNQKTNNRTNTMKSIAEKLGLAAEASESSILEAVVKIQNRIVVLEPFEADNTKLKNRIAEFDTEQITALLDLHGVKEDKLRNRLTATLCPMKNREERMTALADFGLKPVEAKAEKGNAARIINRGDIRGAAQETAGTEQEKAQKIRNRAETLKATNPTASFETRWAMATQEVDTAK